MDNWFIKRLESLVDGIIFAAIVAAAVAVWALISKLSAPIIFVIGIATFAAILTILNQVNIWRERHKGKISALSDQEIENTILKWITIPNFKIERKPDPNTIFSFLVTDSEERGVTVIRKREDPTQLLLAIKILPSEDLKAKLAVLGNSLGSELIRNIRLELARLGIGFEGVDWPFRQIALSEMVSLDDSLTKVYLLQRIMFVRRAQHLIIELLSQRIDQSLAK